MKSSLAARKIEALGTKGMIKEIRSIEGIEHIPIAESLSTGRHLNTMV
jgi:hypothetical protein